MKKLIIIVCFCLSASFFAQNKNVTSETKAQQTVNSQTEVRTGDIKKSDGGYKISTPKKATLLDKSTKGNENTPDSKKNASQPVIPKEKKKNDDPKDAAKNLVKETAKLSKGSSPDAAKKTENRKLGIVISSFSEKAQKTSKAPMKKEPIFTKIKNGVADDLKKQIGKLSEEKRRNEDQIKKLSGDLEKISMANDAEKAEAKRKFLTVLLFTFLFLAVLLYYFIKNKRLKSTMNHQKLSLKEVIKKQELLFNQFIEFSKKKLNVDDLEKKILFMNPASERSVLKSEKDNYLEFIARIKNNMSILSKGIQEAGKELKEKEDALTLLKEKMQEPNLSENYLKLGQKKQELEKENAMLKQQFAEFEKDNTAVIPNYSVPSDIYISSHILVSAGPRKEKENDTELGEDSSGIYNTPYGTYFWILDGTSDSGRIESEKHHIFSSRVLAQQLGNAIFTVVSGKEFEKSGNGDTLKSILGTAVATAKANMVNTVKNASYEIHQQIIDHIHNNQKPYCSTTILLGFLDKNGNLWHLYLGDSQLYSFSISDDRLILNKQENNEGRGRLFLSMNIYKEKNIVFETNNYEEKIINIAKEQGVDYVMAFSDGIGSSEKVLSVNPRQVLSKISFTDQKSYDDKSLLVLERKKFL